MRNNINNEFSWGRKIMWGEPFLRPVLARAAAHILIRAGCYSAASFNSENHAPVSFDLTKLASYPADIDRLLNLTAAALAPWRPDHITGFDAAGMIDIVCPLADKLQAGAIPLSAAHIKTNDVLPRDRVVIICATSIDIMDSVLAVQDCLAAKNARLDVLFTLFDDRAITDIISGEQRIHALTNWAEVLEVMHLTGYGDAGLRADLGSYVKSPLDWQTRGQRAAG
jgi:hypothetical protein